MKKLNFNSQYCNTDLVLFHEIVRFVKVRLDRLQTQASDHALYTEQDFRKKFNFAELYYQTCYNYTINWKTNPFCVPFFLTFRLHFLFLVSHGHEIKMANIIVSRGSLFAFPP